jgi:hypothetical protein
MTFKMQVLGLGQTQTCGGVKLVDGITTHFITHFICFKKKIGQNAINIKQKCYHKN